MSDTIIENLSVSPLGNSWIEVGTICTASVSINVSGIPNNNVATVSGNVLNGNGFGRITISVGTLGTFDLYVGSVIIAGADGKSWQVFSDGSCRALQPDQISQRIQTLEQPSTGNPVLFADVGNTNIYDATPVTTGSTFDPAKTTAVTCYLLNLQVVTRKS